MRMISKEQRVSAMQGEAWSFPPLSAFLKVWLEHDLSMARRNGSSLAIFVLRVDAYHDLASSFDRETLEAALSTLSSRLKKTFGLSDAFVRSGKDRFTVIQPFSGDQLDLHGIAKSMLKVAQRPLRLGPSDQSLAASIGIACYPEDGNSAERLLEGAEAALRRTDRWGGNGFCIHSASSAKKIADELSAHEEFRHALAEADLELRFQPVLDLQTNSMTGVFGGGHWQCQNADPLDMMAIATLAERAKLIAPFDEWLIDSVCRQLIDWRGQGSDRPISFTLSRAQILDRHFSRLLSQRLRAAGLCTSLLDISIDQDLILDGTDHRVFAGLHRLADLGIGLSLNNVGVGALAMQNLAKLPIRSINLAPELTAVIGRSASAETMIVALIGFAHHLGLSVRAVDISSQAQLDFLKRKGCDEATGTLFAPALKGADIDRFIHLKPAFTQQMRLGTPQPRASMH